MAWGTNEGAPGNVNAIAVSHTGKPPDRLCYLMGIRQEGVALIQTATFVCIRTGSVYTWSHSQLHLSCWFHMARPPEWQIRRLILPLSEVERMVWINSSFLIKSTPGVETNSSQLLRLLLNRKCWAKLVLQWSTWRHQSGRWPSSLGFIKQRRALVLKSKLK